MSKVSSKNSYYQPLEEGDVWVGSLEDVAEYESITINYTSDTSGILTFQFSVDGNHFEDYNIDVTTNYFDNIPITSKYLRVKFLNNSEADQTFLRIQTLYKMTVSDVQVSGVVNIENGSSPINTNITNKTMFMSKPFEFIPTPYNSTPEVYALGQQPLITAYGTWNYTNTSPEKITWYFYRTLKQTDLSLSSLKNGYAVIENKSGSTAWPFIAVYSLPDGYGDAEAWYKSRWVYENTNEVLNIDERLVLWFGQEVPLDIEPTLRHIQLNYNANASAGPRSAGEQLGLIALNTDSGEDTGAYNFDLTKFGINWYSYQDTVSGQKPEGIMIKNDLSELVVSNSPFPSNALKPYRNINTNLTASNIKLGPTWLHTINTSNDDNNHLFLKLYSSSTQPTENDTPVWTVRVHQNQSNDINFNVPLYTEFGFWVRCSTGVADDDIGEPSANGCIFNCAFY
jgi:hypothetical protein